MFYPKGFLETFATNVCISVVMFVTAVVIAPTLSLTVGGGVTRLILACAALYWRFAMARIGARHMWERNAPLSRIAINLVPAAALGAAFPFVVFAAIDTLSGQSLALANLSIDALFVALIVTAAIVVEKPRLPRTVSAAS